jgi:hypothetical protein
MKTKCCIFSSPGGIAEEDVDTGVGVSGDVGVGVGVGIGDELD